MTRRALLIGINYFGTGNQLSGCVNDIENVKDLLINTLGFADKNIVVMVDSEDDPSHLSPCRPTRAKVVAAIQSIVKATQAGDTLYIHYSGHGTHYRNYDGLDVEIDAQDEYMCTVDNSYIKDDELHAIVNHQIADKAKVVIVFDCCHSGTMLDLSYKWSIGQKVDSNNPCKYCTSKCVKIVTISGCMDRQTSADAYIGVVPDFKGEYAGALTWALIKSIKEACLKGVNNLRQMTWKDLAYNIRFKIKSGGYEQVPQLCSHVKSDITDHIYL
jgi:hypothetical protein